MMAKFMFLQRSSGDCENRPEMSPEEMETMMKSWMEWMKTGTEAGWLLDPGSSLGVGAVVQPDMSVIDGPFAESKELVGGYTIVEAADLAEACEYAKQTMKLAGGGKIEVREIANHGQ